MNQICSSASERLDRPDDATHFTTLIEARDFLDVHLPGLPEKQRRTIVAWSEGKSCIEIAADEGVSRFSVHQRIGAALRRLREFAGN